MWIAITGNTNVVSEFKISNLFVYQQDGEVLFNNFNGKNARELFKGIDEALSGVRA